MDLDQHQIFASLDPQDMYSHIDGLPDQLQKAWTLGKGQPEPTWSGLSGAPDIQQIVIAGMGGSAIGGDLLTAYLDPYVLVPIFVHRDYGLPAWVRGPGTLVIASSHSGNTEETLDSFAAAWQRGCRCLAVATGGNLVNVAREAGLPVWIFEHHGQPRAAVGYSFGMLLALFYRLGLLPRELDIEKEVRDAATAMRQQQVHLRKEVHVVNNPAKRYAGQLVGRWVSVMGSGLLAPVARRWKGQVSEIAKAWAQFEFIPEADHNTLAGTVNTDELLSHIMVLFLRSSTDHPRNILRLEHTRYGFMLEGLGTDTIDAQGEARLAQQWTILHFGDYMAYYLAMLYEVDPTPVTALQSLKARMGAVSQV
jgi:glucose/mannose-6-phosphate isomerase